jgi:hypothetical protein
MDTMLRLHILNTERHITSQITSRKICGGQSGTRKDFLQSTLWVVGIPYV